MKRANCRFDRIVEAAAADAVATAFVDADAQVSGLDCGIVAFNKPNDVKLLDDVEGIEDDVIGGKNPGNRLR
ncbi:hypothetical protein QR98_0013250 [Sarcoptes scabiei]|uniref:Uncharacterized protein n=1 Tax=Sarcoptes scabiei TaxID=52283 RepID=A0A131ZWJ5_SARSC|nr:hypothetical protein QR98_0013250 [Sarcoptes scabiei]